MKRALYYKVTCRECQYSSGISKLEPSHICCLTRNPGVLHQAHHSPRPRRLRKIPQPVTRIPQARSVPMHQISQFPKISPTPSSLSPFPFLYQNHSKNPTVATSLAHTHITMSRPMTRLFTQRLGAAARLSPARPLFRAPGARRFASGESGPNPKPGQSPFKVWPFVAITLLGTGSYILMARSRDGSCMLSYLSPLAELELGRSGEGGSKRRVIQGMVAA